MVDRNCFDILKRFPDEGYTLLEITGHIGVEETENMRKCFSREIGNERPWVLLKLRGVTFISSSGMSALLMAVADARSYGGDVVFVEVPEKVLKVLEFLDVLDFIRVAKTDGEAMKLIDTKMAATRERAPAVDGLIKVDPEKDLLYDGIAHWEKGNYNKAIKVFDALLTKNPNNEQALKWKISALERLGRFSEARKLEFESKIKGN